MSKKQMLDIAFEEAINTVNTNSLTKDVEFEVLATAMKGFAERESLTFTDDEIKATIIAGIETLKKAGVDFTLQTKMMN